MAAQSRIHHPPLEFDAAGSLLSEHLEEVRCEPIDVLVPTLAEIIIEGVPPRMFLKMREPDKVMSCIHLEDYIANLDDYCGFS
jgi:hypothetical protein